jgi:hypothetical protein
LLLTCRRTQLQRTFADLHDAVQLLRSAPFIMSSLARCIVLLALSLLSAAPDSVAQSSLAGLSLTATRPSRLDTVLAVRRLFKAKDAGSTEMLGSGLLLVVGTGIAAFAPPTVVGSLGSTQAPAVGLLSSGISIGVGLVRSMRYRNKRRDEVLAAYEQGEPLPTYVRRRLKPKYFRPSR